MPGLIADVAGDKPEAEKRLEVRLQGREPDAAHGRRLRPLPRPHGQDGGSKDGATRDFDKLLPRHPVIRRRDGQDSTRASRWKAPCPTRAAGAAEVLYGLGAAGNRQGDELAAMLYLRLALWLAPAERARRDHARRHLRPAEAAGAGQRHLRSRVAATRRCAAARTSRSRSTSSSSSARTRRSRISRRSIAADPKDVEALIALGNVYRSRKDFAKAAEVYTRAIDAIDEARPRLLGALLLPRHRLRAHQAVAEGGSRLPQGAGAARPTSRSC